MATATSEPKTYMPLFIGDYLADTSDLSAEEHGAYLLLLMTMWRRGGSLPSDSDRLSRIASVSAERWPGVWAAIGDLFLEDGGEITQKRLIHELEAARDRKAAASERGRKAARQRWAKQSGDDSGDAPGNARAMRKQCTSNARALPKQGPSNAQAMLEQCPSTSTSTSTSTSPAVVVSNRIDVDATAAEVIEYWNDLADHSWNAASADGEYLRERLLEGRSFDACCQVVEAAMVSGVDHPRQAFSRKCFGGLLATRRNPRKWAELRDEFDAVLERYCERTG